ncbi:MAG: 30S ribosomal protein S2 [Candidatus Omnitrophica bacterium]|nr:30S ribosomal protein S2 [Candidatus Omnitrophota bacterium]
MEVTIKELLESGVYFGHPTRQFDPRIKPFLYGKRQGIYIIDIEKSLEKIKEAGEFLKKAAADNKTILFVGTKKQAQAPIKESADKCGMPYVDYRWIGGTLTNFNEIRKRIGRLDEIEELENSGKLSLYTKKEASLLLKEKGNLLKKFAGIRNLNKYPDIIVVVDVRKEINIIREAKKVGIKIVGIVDTNSNPDLLDYPIPANDDGLKSVSLILSKLSECVAEGKASGQYQVPVTEQEKAKLGEEPVPGEEKTEEAEDAGKKAPVRKKAKEKKTEEEPEKNET